MRPLASTDEAPNLAIDSRVVNPAGGVCRKSFFLPLAVPLLPVLFPVARTLARTLHEPHILRDILGDGNPPGGPFYPTAGGGPRCLAKRTPPRERVDNLLSALQMVVLQGKNALKRGEEYRREERRVQKRGERSSESDRRFATLSHLSRPAPALPFSRALSARLPRGVELASGIPPASGAEGTRTLDPRLAKPMLSQLSYGPRDRASRSGLTGTSGGSLVSNRQWAHEDSNFGPRRYQRRALTN